MSVITVLEVNREVWCLEWLLELLNLLKKYKIDHCSESMPRSSLDDLCMSSAKQHFFHPDLIGQETSISRKNKTVCKGCAVIPRNRVPDEFFLNFFDGMLFWT